MRILGAQLQKWVLRYIRYNIIGLGVFLINIVIYFLIFDSLGEWSYIVVSIIGGILEFALISYFNKTRKGMMFEGCACTPNESESAILNDK